LVVTALVAVADRWLGRAVSLSMLYLVPVSLAAWRAGFAHGLLLALVAAVASYFADDVHAAAAYPAARLWNAVIRFCVFVLTSSLLARLHAALRRERALARTDPLTGVANGRTFYEIAHMEVLRAARTGRPFTLAYLDLDNFKEVNDRLGHTAGDTLLCRVAGAVRKATRATDLVARLGGDEFIVLLPETDAAGGQGSLHKLQQCLVCELGAEAVPVTCSIGSVTYVDAPPDIDVMIRLVDGVMYRAKENGKNRICHESYRARRDEAAGRPPAAERRASARVLCNHPARVRYQGPASAAEAVATVCNMSAQGMGFFFGSRLEAGTILTVEPLFAGRVKVLLARVVHATEHPRGWLHGCALSCPLNGTELDDWVH
jgi:diguanylate cyclase (GGDEF)-like protein